MSSAGALKYKARGDSSSGVPPTRQNLLYFEYFFQYRQRWTCVCFNGSKLTHSICEADAAHKNSFLKVYMPSTWQ